MLHPGYLGGVKAPGSNTSVSTPTGTASQLLNAGVGIRGDPADAARSTLAPITGTCPKCGHRGRPMTITVRLQAWTPMLQAAVRAVYTGSRQQPDSAQSHEAPEPFQRAEVDLTEVPAVACHRCGTVGVDPTVEQQLGALRTDLMIPLGVTVLPWSAALTQLNEEVDHGHSCGPAARTQ